MGRRSRARVMRREFKAHLTEGKSFSTRLERGIISEVSGNNQIRCKQDIWKNANE